MNVPIRYIPKNLTQKDKQKQAAMLRKSRSLYKKHKYYTRKSVPSFHSKPSNHIENAKRIYRVEKVVPNKELSVKTGCSISALRRIVRKGEGAYFSSGSRPNQTARSWGLARLASSITGGKAAAVDYNIIDTGCDHNKKAFRLANRSKRQYNHGQSKTPKTSL